MQLPFYMTFFRDWNAGLGSWNFVFEGFCISFRGVGSGGLEGPED